MKLTSMAFINNDNIPEKYTCNGQNINPPLEIGGVPKNTKSLVLITDDPDAPVGIWTHWIVWNILPDTKEVIENSTPDGATVGANSSGKQSYMGPC